MKYFSLECKRMFTSKRFGMSLIMVAIFLVCGAYDMFDGGYDIVEAMMFSLGANPTAVLALFWTMIGSVPWTISFFEERECGYKRYLQMKAGRRKYLVSKFLANMLASFSIIIIPETILLFIFFGIKGTDVTLSHVYDISYLPELAVQQPVLYCILLMLATAMATVSYSSISLASSVVIQNKFLAVVLPFPIYIISCLVFGYTKLFFLSGSYLYDLNDMEKPYYGVRMATYLGIILICLFVFVRGNQNEEKNM